MAWACEGERRSRRDRADQHDADGTRNGDDLEISRAVARRSTFPWSPRRRGSSEHLRAVRPSGKASAALAASIFHYRQYSIPETKDDLARHGVLVRGWNRREDEATCSLAGRAGRSLAET